MTTLERWYVTHVGEREKEGWEGIEPPTPLRVVRGHGGHGGGKRERQTRPTRKGRPARCAKHTNVFRVQAALQTSLRDRLSQKHGSAMADRAGQPFLPPSA